MCSFARQAVIAIPHAIGADFDIADLRASDYTFSAAGGGTRL